jgi:hypothetical protein
MARQRFIWPDLWTDPGFGRMGQLEQVLYIGCFSNADDEGRLLGDPPYLKATILPYQPHVGVGKVKSARNAMLVAMPKLVLYVVSQVEYLAFTNWTEWQKPKYPKPSRFPEPFRESLGEVLPNGSGNDSSVGWVGLGDLRSFERFVSDAADESTG